MSKKYIDCEAAFEMITDLVGVETIKSAYAAIWKSAKVLNKIPTADVVEVVRCEKCKYFFDECCNHEKNRVLHRVPDFGKHYVYVGRIKVEPDHFCSYGERKEGDGNG